MVIKLMDSDNIVLFTLQRIVVNLLMLLQYVLPVCMLRRFRLCCHHYCLFADTNLAVDEINCVLYWNRHEVGIGKAALNGANVKAITSTGKPKLMCYFQ